MTLMLALVGCGSGASELSRSGFIGVELDTPRPVPDLVLTDHRGEPFNLASETAGRVALIFFGYTNCPDICPVHLANLAAVLNKLPDSDRRAVQVIFVTVDPERDTPELLASYVPAFDPRFLGMYGDAQATERTAKTFRVFYQKVPGKTPGSYTVDHTAGSYVYDPEGRLRLFIKHGTGPEPIAHDLRTLLAG